MVESNLPEPDLLRQVLSYDPESGSLSWLSRSVGMFTGSEKCRPEAAAARWNSRFAGKPAFQTDFSQGYKCGEFNGQTLLAHRVVWAIHYGQWPKGVIDHINHNRADNRISNLRDVSQNKTASTKVVQK